jgi:hypothetical protein
MKTLFQVVEVWVPDSEGLLLEMADGLHCNALDFGRASRPLCFGRGEGLPGRVWDEGRPIVLKDLQNSYFRRATAAKSAGLTCAVGVPVYAGGTLKAVLLFFCRGDSADIGAIELWRSDAHTATDLALVDGYYGATPAAFEAMSRQTVIGRGAGLPALAAQRERAVFMDDLGSAEFLRSDAAAAVGICNGLAIPCPVPGKDTYVMSFLAGPSAPIASRIEIWALDGAGPSLRRVFGFCEGAGPLPVGELAPAGFEAEAVASVYANGVPCMRKSAAMVGAGGLMAMPVFSGGRVAEVVVMHF